MASSHGGDLSEREYDAENWNMRDSLQIKTLIERYKNLEQLMKKKKVLTQIENYHMDVEKKAEAARAYQLYEKNDAKNPEAADKARQLKVQVDDASQDDVDKILLNSS